MGILGDHARQKLTRLTIRNWVTDANSGNVGERVVAQGEVGARKQVRGVGLTRIFRQACLVRLDDVGRTIDAELLGDGQRNTR